MIHFTDVQSVPAGVPVASTVHDLTMFRLPALFPEEYRDTSTTLMYQRATRATVRRARVFICVSEQTRDDLCELFPESSERAVVVRSGVRKPPPGFARAPGDPPRILHVGRIEHRKNLRSVLVALQGLARAGERFIFDVVGSEVSHGATEIIEYARACDPDKAWIRIHGEVTDDELWHLMERATVLVAPSLYEGFDFPPLEALSAGLPVIASDTPVHREILAGLAGLVPPTRIEGWRELLHVAIREPKTLDAGHAKAVLSQRGVDWDQCVQGTLKAYARCLS
jgi:alpha-1,3-rhamnosyl/mannosyltransferase